MKQDFTIWRNQILQNPRDISPLKFGISQDEVIEIFGKPDAVSTMKSDGKPLILKYHDIELHFDKLMRSEKHKYLLKIAFGRFDSVRHRYYPLSPYNGPLREGVKPDSANGWYPREDFADAEERATWFSPDKI